MSPFKKQKFIDVECQENGVFSPIDLTPWNAVQLKYDGHWCRLEFDSSGHGTGYTTSDRIETDLDFKPFANSVLLAEHVFGTNWADNCGFKGSLVLFDSLIWHGDDISAASYRDRFSTLQKFSQAHPRLFVAFTRPVQLLPEVWNKFVFSKKFEGVVLRNWNSAYDNPVHRAKRDFEVTYRCAGFLPGEGKHEGRLGALICSSPETDEIVMTTAGKPAACGGGFTDEQRLEIWTNQSAYLGREFDATGKGLFESGALRHPNFLRWK